MVSDWSSVWGNSLLWLYPQQCGTIRWDAVNAGSWDWSHLYPQQCSTVRWDAVNAGSWDWPCLSSQQCGTIRWRGRFSLSSTSEFLLCILHCWSCTNSTNDFYMHAFMHWCQYEVRNFLEIEEEVSSFAQENCVVAHMYVGDGRFGPS